MTEEQRQRIIAMQQQGMRAMTPEQMAERERQQAAGMRNVAHEQQRAYDYLRNFWPAAETIGPANMPPMTRRQRFTQWLSRFWA